MIDSEVHQFSTKGNTTNGKMKVSAVRMLLRLYSLCVLILDFFCFSIYAAFEIFLTVLHIFKPRSRKSIKDNVAVVVGASRGIGREIALELALLEAQVICIDINSVGNESTVKQIKVNGGRAHAYTCDVTSEEMVIKTAAKIREDFGPISMLFHCCGVPSPRCYISKPVPVKSTLDVSVLSHFWLLEAILPDMKKQRNGHIVLLTCMASTRGIKHQMPLGVAQFAVQGLFESLLENIRIEKVHNVINATLVHIYPFVVSEGLANDIAMRVPNWFGTIDARLAAKYVLEGVLRNEIEVSIPKNVLYVGHAMRLLPRKVVLLLREFLDTGVDFG